MDKLAAVTFVASMFVVGYLAHERGFNQKRWLWTAAIIGPFAIPMIYLVQAAAALKKMRSAPRR